MNPHTKSHTPVAPRSRLIIVGNWQPHGLTWVARAFLSGPSGIRTRDRQIMSPAPGDRKPEVPCEQSEEDVRRGEGASLGSEAERGGDPHTKSHTAPGGSSYTLSTCALILDGVRR